MKIAHHKLKQIIKEEITKLLEKWPSSWETIQAEPDVQHPAKDFSKDEVEDMILNALMKQMDETGSRQDVIDGMHRAYGHMDRTIKIKVKDRLDHLQRIGKIKARGDVVELY